MVCNGGDTAFMKPFTKCRITHRCSAKYLFQKTLSMEFSAPKGLERIYFLKNFQDFLHLLAGLI